MNNDRVESKVWAATIGAGAGSAVSAFLLWVLGVTLWRAPGGAEYATQAISAVPAPVAGIVVLVVTVGGAFAAGYMTKHTPRPDLDEPEPIEDEAPPVWPDHEPAED